MAGAGIWVGGDIIITLRPVVALTDSMPYVNRPFDPPSQRVLARVRGHRPISGSSLGLTILEADKWSEISQGYEAAPFREGEPSRGAVEVDGFPDGYNMRSDTGVVLPGPGGPGSIFYIDWYGSGFKRGYGGAPAFRAGGIIGMVVPSELTGSGKGALIPVHMLLEAIPELRDINRFMAKQPNSAEPTSPVRTGLDSTDEEPDAGTASADRGTTEQAVLPTHEDSSSAATLVNTVISELADIKYGSTGVTDAATNNPQTAPGRVARSYNNLPDRTLDEIRGGPVSSVSREQEPPIMVEAGQPPTSKRPSKSESQTVSQTGDIPASTSDGGSTAGAAAPGQAAPQGSQPQATLEYASPPTAVSAPTAPPPEARRRADREINTRTHALSDAPSESDLLNYKDYALAIARFIQDPRTEQPLVIGIDAPWGMGKTTLMRMIRTELANIGPALLEKKDSIPSRPFEQAKPRTKDSIPTAWFNAWKYDKEESLWAALIIEILQEVKSRLGFWKRQRFYLKLTWKRTDWDAFCQDIVRGLPAYFISALVALAVVIIARVAYGRLEGAGWLTLPLAAGAGAFVYEALAHYTKVFGSLEAKLAEYTKEPDYRRRVGFLKELEDDIARIVSLVTNKGRWPLVVFIDDLDRCAPPKPVEIIEAINLLLSVQHCIFAIGMDSQAVAASIEAKYKDLAAGVRASDSGSAVSLGRRFLEKIVQVYFRIPPPDAGAFGRFLKEILAGRTNEAAAAETHFPSVAESSASQKEADDGLKRKVAEDLIKAEQRAGNTVLDNAVAKIQEQTQVVSKEALEQAKQSVGTEQAEQTRILEDAVSEAATYLGQNMRKMKRFINAYRLQLAIAKERALTGAVDFDHKLLARMLIFETRWPDIFEAIATDA